VTGTSLSRLAVVWGLLAITGCAASPGDPVMDDGGRRPRANALSDRHVARLRRQFVGRVFVLRTDWCEGCAIREEGVYPPGGGPGVRYLGAVPPVAFPAGTAGRIVGMDAAGRFQIAFLAETDSGRPLAIPIVIPRFRLSITDDLFSVEFVERNLTRRALRFVETAPGQLPADSARQAPRTAGPAPVPSPSPVATAPTSSPRSTVLALDVSAEPTRVQQGEAVSLVLSYALSGGGSGVLIRVREERTLLFGGAILMNYPVRAHQDRAPGTFRTRSRQLIPVGAQAGTYTYRGEVCVGDDCISRSTTFEVTP
jgi:hypothetical protein